MLLMFGVGLHFSIDSLLKVRKIALPGAVVQIGVATAIGWGALRSLGVDEDRCKLLTQKLRNEGAAGASPPNRTTA